VIDARDGASARCSARAYAVRAVLLKAGVCSPLAAGALPRCALAPATG